MQIISTNVNDSLDEPLVIVFFSLIIIPYLLICTLLTIWSCLNWKTVKTEFSDLFDEKPFLKFMIPFALIVICLLHIMWLVVTIRHSEWSVIECIIVVLQIFPFIILLIQLMWWLFRILQNLFFKTKNNH